jgi:hypothetical protein
MTADSEIEDAPADISSPQQAGADVEEAGYGFA